MIQIINQSIWWYSLCESGLEVGFLLKQVVFFCIFLVIQAAKDSYGVSTVAKWCVHRKSVWLKVKRKKVPLVRKKIV